MAARLKAVMNDPAAVVALLAETPAAAAEKDKIRQYPLHYGMRNKAPAAAILAVLQAHPAAAGKKDVDGRYPLHYGMTYKAPAEAILAVVQAYPAAAAQKDDFSELYPLYLGMANNAPAGAILAVLQAPPAAAAEKDKIGRHQLHYGMINKVPVEVIVALLQAPPAAAAGKDNHGWYPLHYGMQNNAPADAILALLQAHPAAAAEKDFMGRYPLHYGMVNNAPVAVILAVLRAHPDAAAGQNLQDYDIDDGRLLLHVGIINNAPAEAILALLQQHPAATGEKDRNGKYLLHHGIINNAPAEVILALLQEHPAAAGEKDDDGRYTYPLHLGMANKAPAEVILALLQHYPAGAAEKDDNGRYPLQLEIANNARAEVIVALLLQHPAAAWEKDQAGRSTLYHAVHKPGSGGAVAPGPLRSLIAAQNLNDQATFDAGDLAALFKPADLAPDAKIEDSGDDGDCDSGAQPGSPGEFEQFARLRAVLAVPVSWATKVAEQLTPGELCRGWTALMVAIDLEAVAAFVWLLGRHASDPSFVHGDPELLGRKAVASAKASHTKSIEAWGRSYGHFLGRYVLDGAPKHVSPTCCVIFAKDLQAAESFVVIIAGSPDTTKATFATTEALFRDKTWIHDDATLKEFQTAVKAGTAFHNLKISSVKPGPEQVVLKFMHDPVAFQRELDCRKNGLGDSKVVISVIRSHQSDEITAKSLKAFKQVHLSTENPDQDTSLDLLLVLERGSSDLSDIISHTDLAGKNMVRVRSIALGAASCLQYLHGEGKMHGDFKVRRLSVRPSLGPTVVVRRRQTHGSSCYNNTDLSLSLVSCPPPPPRSSNVAFKTRNLVMRQTGDFSVIDLDAAATIDATKARDLDIPAEERGLYLAGQKDTSSGCLPPEQAAVVLYHRQQAALNKGGGAGRRQSLVDREVELKALRAKTAQAVMEENDKESERLMQLIKALKSTHGCESQPEPEPVVASMAYDIW